MSSSQKVTWGTSEIIYFTRALGTDTIPHKGSYPISLGEEISREFTSVDCHVRELQDSLRSRLSRIQNSNPNCELLESRQFDYKANSTNVLFSPTSEHDRISMLHDLAKSTNFSTHLAERTREIKSILSSRENTGCSCKPLKVDKLSVGKMKSIIEEHPPQVIPDLSTLSKVELTSLVRESLKQCSLCSTNNCECVFLGVPCGPDSCGCLRGGHQPCNNPMGHKAFDFESVKQYRHRILTSFCTDSEANLV